MTITAVDNVLNIAPIRALKSEYHHQVHGTNKVLIQDFLKQGAGAKFNDDS